MNRLPQPQLVIFDLDGTLVDSAGDIRHAANQAFVHCGLAEQSLEQITQWIGGGAEIFITKASEYFAVPERFDELYRSFMQFYTNLSHEHSRVYDGVVEWLDCLQSRDISMAIATNKPEKLVAPLLKYFGLDSYFQMVVGGDSFEKRKPHPMPLLEVCEHFSCSTSDAWMVGDSDKDSRAAEEAGIAFIGVNCGYQQESNWMPTQVPSVLVHELNELRSALKAQNKEVVHA